jgi:hypothetical protein
MAAIVALRKQILARAADGPGASVPSAFSSATAINVHQTRDLPYLQLQTQPGGAAVQQRDISSFFRPPPVTSNTGDADEYSNALCVRCCMLAVTCDPSFRYAKVFISWSHGAAAACSTLAAGVPVGHLVPGSRFTVDFFKREVALR